jgi:GT2 family glycosyltransferase
VDISAVVVSFNSQRFLKRNLDSLFRQTTPFTQIIVVDNGSSDGSASVLASFPGLETIFNDANRGYAAAANQGIRRARAELVLVANADIYLADEFNREILRFIACHPRASLVSPLILRFDRSTVDSAGQAYSLSLHPREIGFAQPLSGKFLRERELFSVCGAATVFSRTALEKLKVDDEYYDEDFFMFWEDFDLGWRANQLGLKAFLAPRALAYHYRSGTLEPTRASRFSLALARPAALRLHLIKNRYLTLIKNFRLSRYWWALPFIFVKDLLWVGALTIGAPKIIIALARSRASFARAFAKRSQLKKHE